MEYSDYCMGGWINNADLYNADTCFGYQMPKDVEYHNIDDEQIFHRISHNDPSIEGLRVWVCDPCHFPHYPSPYYEDEANLLLLEEDLAAKGAAIGRNQTLRKLSIRDNLSGMRLDITSLLTEVAKNRSIEHLCLNAFDMNTSTMDTFRILAPFFEHNRNLRCMQITCYSVSNRIPDFISLLQLKTLRLERIDLSWSSIGDESAAVLIDALNCIPGLSYLLDLILERNKIGRRGCLALRGLLENSATKLQRLDLSGNYLDDDCLEDLTNGLIRNDTVKILTLNHQERNHPGERKRITSIGWRIFSVYVANPNCSIEMLDLSENNIEDAGLISLGTAIARNKTLQLKYLDLSKSESVTSAGWKGLSIGLECSVIEELHISCSHNISDEGGLALVSACSKSMHFKTLNMGRCSSFGMRSDGITSAGWIHCFPLLIDSYISLENLLLPVNDINDEGAAMLVELLGAHTSFKLLDLSSSNSITSAGWIRCFQLLRNSKPSLETLFLDRNNIDNEGAELLIELIAEDFSLSTLSLQRNRSITIDVWSAFTEVLLPASSSKLKVLKLGAMGEHPGDDTSIEEYVIAYYHILARNTTVERMKLFDPYNNPAVMLCDWYVFAEALCDNSSITSICQSNHTLHQLTDMDDNDERFMPDVLRSLLKINSNKDKDEVIRMKILKYFFTDGAIGGCGIYSDGANVERTFANFAATMMPHAIGWIGRDCLGYSAMYHLFRCMPWLIDSGANYIPFCAGANATQTQN